MEARVGIDGPAPRPALTALSLAESYFEDGVGSSTNNLPKILIYRIFENLALRFYPHIYPQVLIGLGQGEHEGSGELPEMNPGNSMANHCKRCVNHGVAYRVAAEIFFKAHGSRFSMSSTVSACGTAVKTSLKY